MSLGFGGQLLAAAARRCIRAATEVRVGGVMLVIDAKNERSGQVVNPKGETYCAVDSVVCNITTVH